MGQTTTIILPQSLAINDLQNLLATILFHPRTVGPPYPWAPYLQIQPTANRKYSGKKKKIPASFKQAKLEFAANRKLVTWHLHCIRYYK